MLMIPIIILFIFSSCIHGLIKKENINNPDIVNINGIYFTLGQSRGEINSVFKNNFPYNEVAIYDFKDRLYLDVYKTKYVDFNYDFKSRLYSIIKCQPGDMYSFEVAKRMVTNTLYGSPHNVMYTEIGVIVEWNFNEDRYIRSLIYRKLTNEIARSYVDNKLLLELSTDTLQK
jgi:ABC-type antimicrobial peptide transport system permease subunit